MTSHIELNDLYSINLTCDVYRKEVLPPKAVSEGEEAPETQEVEYKETTTRNQYQHLIYLPYVYSLKTLLGYLNKSVALTADQLALQSSLLGMQSAYLASDAASEATEHLVIRVVDQENVTQAASLPWGEVWDMTFDKYVLLNFPQLTQALDPISGSIEQRTFSLSVAWNIPIIGF